VIRPAHAGDRDAIWAILEPVFRAGDTYAMPADVSREDALTYWFRPGNDVFVADEEGHILGTYVLRPNQAGGGSHVANCGYMTAPASRGRGTARAMLEHSLAEARARGYQAMQFNFVVSTNGRAVTTWMAYGFEVVGRLPGAFRHPIHGFVDALVMFRRL
jgi:ribosomal protein S18 acetylase RimI-like enzyme